MHPTTRKAQVTVKILLLFFLPHFISGIRSLGRNSNTESIRREISIPKVKSNGPIFIFEGKRWTFIVPDCQTVKCGSLGIIEEPSSTGPGLEKRAQEEREENGERSEGNAPGPDGLFAAVPAPEIQVPPEKLAQRWMEHARETDPELGDYRYYRAVPLTSTLAVDEERLFELIGQGVSHWVPREVQKEIAVRVGPDVDVHYILSPRLIYTTLYYEFVPPGRDISIATGTGFSHRRHQLAELRPWVPLRPDPGKFQIYYDHFRRVWTRFMENSEIPVRDLLNNAAINYLKERVLVQRFLASRDWRRAGKRDANVEDIAEWARDFDWTFMTRYEAICVLELMKYLQTRLERVAFEMYLPILRPGNNLFPSADKSLSEDERGLEEKFWQWARDKIYVVRDWWSNAPQEALIALTVAIELAEFRLQRPQDYRSVPSLQAVASPMPKRVPWIWRSPAIPHRETVPGHQGTLPARVQSLLEGLDREPIDVNEPLT
ncbi:MAG: hypothetical protein M1831_002713 [Alyxoria varia]|nr:MAG: hypothetical protein M1831_002713 [Alyxoria varia]